MLPRTISVSRWVDRSRNWWQRSYVAVASIYYRLATRLRPHDPWMHYHLAKMRLQRRDWSGAERAYRRVLELDSDIALACHELADILQKQQKWEASAKLYRQAITCNPQFFWSHHNLGDVLRHLEQWEEAAEAYQQAAQLNPHHLDTHCNLGQILMRLQRWEEAVVAYRQAADIEPANFDCFYNLAGALMRVGDRAGMAQVYLQTIDIDPQFPWFYHFIFWSTLKSEQKLDKAEELYKKALQQSIDREDDTVEIYVNLGEALTHQDKIPEAIPYYQKSLNRQIQRNYPTLLEKSQGVATKTEPSFIILGAQKAGTSSLYVYLTRHPKVVSGLRKEVEFWSWKFRRGMDWYFAHFPPLPEGEGFISGEACPGYLDFYEAAERMQDVLPNVKLIVLLRNPVDRAVSHYYHWIRRHQEMLPFDRACKDKIRELQDAGSAWNLPSNYIARGMYVEFLKHWFKIFSREQFLILDSEAFYRNPSQTLCEVHEFLGLEPQPLSNYKKYNAGSYSPVDAETRQYLRDFYEPYNRELEDLLGMSFHWQSF
ncbi:MAG: tetratricopeptide repeat protein [Cyanobacteria bacterium SID2]|nr:tetratricopeptide repeat protein [Cyanobacteria bacterium SID2]MBP0005312.1 tetratricopeptide repeat protein [Cyanobacteria bacterium SBC]